MDPIHTQSSHVDSLRMQLRKLYMNGLVHIEDICARFSWTV